MKCTCLLLEQRDKFGRLELLLLSQLVCLLLNLLLGVGCLWLLLLLLRRWWRRRRRKQLLRVLEGVWRLLSVSVLDNKGNENNKIKHYVRTVCSERSVEKSWRRRGQPPRMDGPNHGDQLSSHPTPTQRTLTQQQQLTTNE